MRVYENQFDANEWYVIITLVVLWGLVIILPKIFSIMETVGNILYGISISLFFDHTISTGPWDFYDVNDRSSYQLIDFISYTMYGPYSYLFIYLYKKLNIRGFLSVLYILLWSSISICIEWLAVSLGVFHYDKGYKMYWSFPIYLMVQIGLILFYHLSKKSMRGNDLTLDLQKGN